MGLVTTRTRLDFQSPNSLAPYSEIVTGGLPPYSASSSNTNVATVAQGASNNLIADADTLTSATLTNLTKSSGGPNGATDAEYTGNGTATTNNKVLSESISVTSGQSYILSAYIDPTNIFLSSGGPILNASDKSSQITLDSTGLVMTVNSGFGGNAAIRCVEAAATQKYYWEVVITAIGNSGATIGIGTATATLDYPGSGAGSWGYQSNGTKKLGGGAAQAYGSAFTTGDILGFALDMDGGTLTCYKNGVSQGVMVSGLSGTVFPMLSSTASGVNTARFDASTFSYNAPSGFSPLPKAFIQLADTSGNILTRYALTPSDTPNAKRYATPAWTATVSPVVASVQLTAGAKVSTGLKFIVSQPMLALSSVDSTVYQSPTSVFNVTPKYRGTATITYTDSTP